MYENGWTSSTQVSAELGVMDINNSMQDSCMVRKNMQLNARDNIDV